MGSENFVWTYVQACAGGKLAFSDCGPIWQLGVIAALLTGAIVFLIALRMQPREESVRR